MIEGIQGIQGIQIIISIVLSQLKFDKYFYTLHTQIINSNSNNFNGLRIS